MNPTMTERTGLEETILIMTAKEMRRRDLQSKSDILKADRLLEVSYDLLLTKEEQIKYANLGMFHYWCDLYGKSRAYNDKNIS